MTDHPFTVDDVDQFYAVTSQATIYATGIVNAVNRLRNGDIGLPTRGGTIRTDEVWNRSRPEVAAESIAAAGYMLAEELAKLDSLPAAAVISALRVNTNAPACAHSQALTFCRTVLHTLREVTGFDRAETGRRMTVDRPRPSTEADWQALAQSLVPLLPQLRTRLAQIGTPDADGLSQVMLTERDRVKAQLNRLTVAVEAANRPAMEGECTADTYDPTDDWQHDDNPDNWLGPFTRAVWCEILACTDKTIYNRIEAGTYKPYPSSPKGELSLHSSSELTPQQRVAVANRKQPENSGKRCTPRIDGDDEISDPRIIA